MDTNLIYKVIIIGDTSVGKSSLIKRYINNSYSSLYESTIGVDFDSKVLGTKGKTVKLQIWDTAGQERFKVMTKAFYRGSQAVIFCYDLTKPDSLDSIDHWLELFKSQNISDDTPLFLCGCKSDLKYSPQTLTKAVSYAKSRSMISMICSAKKDHKVCDLFSLVALQIIESQKDNQKKSNPSALSTTLSSSLLVKEGGKEESENATIRYRKYGDGKTSYTSVKIESHNEYNSMSRSGSCSC